MARAYSLDLRERVVAAVDAGQSSRVVAATFGVSVASVVRWSQRNRTTGSPAAKQQGGRRPYVLERELDWLLRRIEQTPEVSVRALCAELSERGIVVSHFAVWHLLKREGMSFKKKPHRRRALAS